LIRNTHLVWLFAHLKIFLGTGQGWIADFKYPILLAIALKVYLPAASNLILGIIVLVGLIVIAFLGWFDLKCIKLSQTINELSTRKYNPYFQKLEKDLNNRTV